MSYAGLLTHEIEARIEELESLIEKELVVSKKRAMNLEKGRLTKELLRRDKAKNVTIPDPANIPHIFFNIELTRPASKELADYLTLCLDHYPESLRYVFNKSQEYVGFGGCRKMTFAQWKTKLKKDLGSCKW